MRRRSLRRIALAAIVAALGLGLLGEQLYLKVKGAVAGVLIEQALGEHLRGAPARPPWSWADLTTLGRLTFVATGERRPVLTGAHGSTLAFGVGHVDGTAAPNASGNCVLAGHRDGAFGILETLRVGSELRLDTAHAFRTWLVKEIQVVDCEEAWPLEPTAVDVLTLVTCYPFDAMTETGLRYVVRCRPIETELLARVDDALPASVH